MINRDIAIVTDSTADLPLSVVQDLGIIVVPLNVILGEKNLKDGVDISSQKFFEMLPASKVHPRTSQPSPGEFSAAYEKALKDHQHVISIHISSQLSGTHQSATLASELIGKGKVTVVDTLSASLGLGLVVAAAARARNEGANVAEILAQIAPMIERQVLVLSVDNLVWLERNGRIGKASSLIGTILNVHPVLRVNKGSILAHSKVRGQMIKVLSSMVEAVGEFVPHGSHVHVGIMHGNCESRAQELKSLVANKYEVDQVIINQIGPVIGVHVGPGAIGLVIIPKN